MDIHNRPLYQFWAGTDSPYGVDSKGNRVCICLPLFYIFLFISYVMTLVDNHKFYQLAWICSGHVFLLFGACNRGYLLESSSVCQCERRNY